MKKTISVLLVTMLVIFTLTAFCACGTRNNTAGNNGTIADDARDMIEDGTTTNRNNVDNNGNVTTNNEKAIDNNTTNNSTVHDNTATKTDGTIK